MEGGEMRFNIYYKLLNQLRVDSCIWTTLTSPRFTFIGRGLQIFRIFVYSPITRRREEKKKRKEKKKKSFL